MKPCDVCTMRGCFTPIAVCSVDFGLSRAFRTRLAARVASAAAVRPAAHAASRGTSSGSTSAAKPVASISPEAHPNRM